MRLCFAIATVLIIAASVTSAQEGTVVLFDTAFAENLVPAVGRSGNTNPRITGVLPKGWVADSDWCQVWARFEPMSEEGRAFLRLEVTKTEGGLLQIDYEPLPDIPDESIFLLRADLRNLSGKPVSLGIRMRHAPYQTLWKVEDTFGTRFKEYTYEFVCPPNTQPIGFWVWFPGPGIVDIARIRLERLDKRAYVERLKARLPEGGPANLLRNSRLPLGLQAGWFIGRSTCDGVDLTVAADPQTPGPSGAPALKAHSTNPKSFFYIEPFAVQNPIVPHAFALACKGTGTWTLTVYADGRIAAATNLAPQPDWRRVMAAFDPHLAAKAYMATITGQGTLWLDAFQVGPADKVREGYRSAGECEVALALPPGRTEPDMSAQRIQFLEDPPLVRFCVTGNTSNAVLRSQVVNLYGETNAMRPVRLGGGGLVQGTLAYDAFPRRRLGSFRIEAWVERDGRRISPYNELVVNRLRCPKYWMRDAPHSPFGVHMEADTRTILTLKAAGVNWTRLHDAGMSYLGWFYLEPEKGQWRFRDAELQRFRQYGVKILGELGTAPRWATALRQIQKPFNYTDQFFPPTNLTDYANYVTTVVARYRGVIDAYDVWNEPWQANWWPAGWDPKGLHGGGAYIFNPNADREFAALQRTAYAAAKSVDPSVIIAGFNSTTLPTTPGYITGGRDWTAGVLAAGGWETCDVVDYHGYCSDFVGFPGDDVERGLRTALGPILEAHGGTCPKPVWMTEGQCALSAHRAGFYRHTLVVPDTEDLLLTANANARYHIALLSVGVSKIFLYSAHCYWGLGGASLQVLLSGDGFLHPSGVALAALAWEIEDRPFVRRVELANGVWAHLFSGGGTTVAAICAPRDYRGPALPRMRGLTVRDLFGNTVPRGAPLTDRVIYVSGQMSPDRLESLLRQWLPRR